MVSTKLPLWVRFFLLLGLAAVATGAGLLGYKYYNRPVTLTVAVGSIDGEANKAMLALASRLVTTNAPVRLKVIDSGSALGAADAFSKGQVDLAVVRSDVGDLSQAQAVIVVTHAIVMIVAPSGSSIDSVEKLKGHTVGVIGGEANSKVVDVLTKEYSLVNKVSFKNIVPADAHQAIQSKSVSALIVVIPLTQKYLSQVRTWFPSGPKAAPVLIPIEAAGAIAATERAFESFDLPKGTLRVSPPVPDDDVTTLQATLYLVANKKLGTDLMTRFTQAILSARRDLIGELPVFAQITGPSMDQDAFLPLHPGAAAFYNGTQQSFMDEYGNWIYLTPMALGGAATLLAAAWKFLGLGSGKTEGPLDSLYALGRRIRKAVSDAELAAIEGDIDDILTAERAKAADGDDEAVDAATLNVVAHRLEGLIHDRRAALAKRPGVFTAA
ncbi:ABC transporter substrate-binding protein [Bradyrhizobium sp. 41S5]|nr:TAXI family TRAP transporter solute-binding subunit [Bradyrhizobium sp. 41S5]UFX49211.1 ABC transporter substrate-binding protein [Bradyrhizobium sp. 41S5]